MKDIECKEVIISNLTNRGNGTILNPCRKVLQIYNKNGELLAENDSNNCFFSLLQVISFAKWCKENSIEPINKEAIEKWMEI